MPAGMGPICLILPLKSCVPNVGINLGDILFDVFIQKLTHFTGVVVY